MARKRMIDPNIWQSEDFGKLSMLAKIVFIGLFSNADDQGRGRAKPIYIKSILFPYDEEISAMDIEKAFAEIAMNMSITFYSCKNREYYSLNNWHKWQKVDKAYESLFPEYSDECTLKTFDEHSENIRRTFDEHSTNNQGTFDEQSRLIQYNTIQDNTKEENIFPPDGGEKENLSEETQPEKKSEETKNVKAKPPDGYPKSFEYLWERYPTRDNKKGSKKKSYSCWQKIISKKMATEEQLLSAVDSYAKYCGKNSDIHWAKDCETWLGQGEHWREYLPNADMPNAPPDYDIMKDCTNEDGTINLKKLENIKRAMEGDVNYAEYLPESFRRPT